MLSNITAMPDGAGLTELELLLSYVERGSEDEPSEDGRGGKEEVSPVWFFLRGGKVAGKASNSIDAEDDEDGMKTSREQTGLYQPGTSECWRDAIGAVAGFIEAGVLCEVPEQNIVSIMKRAWERGMAAEDPLVLQHVVSAFHALIQRQGGSRRIVRAECVSLLVTAACESTWGNQTSRMKALRGLRLMATQDNRADVLDVGGLDSIIEAAGSLDSRICLEAVQAAGVMFKSSAAKRELLRKRGGDGIEREVGKSGDSKIKAQRGKERDGDLCREGAAIDLIEGVNDGSTEVFYEGERVSHENSLQVEETKEAEKGESEKAESNDGKHVSRGLSTLMGAIARLLAMPGEDEVTCGMACLRELTREPSREVSLSMVEARLLQELMLLITREEGSPSKEAARLLASILEVQHHSMEALRWMEDMTHIELTALLQMLTIQASSSLMLLMRQLAKSTKTLHALVQIGGSERTPRGVSQGLEVLLDILGDTADAETQTSSEYDSAASVAAGVVVARLCSFPPEVQLQVASHRSALSALLQLAHSQHEVDQQEAVAALLFLSQSASSREALVLNGGAELVTPLAGSDFQSVQALSAIALAELSQDPKSHGPITISGGVRMALNLVSSANLDCARHANIALRNLSQTDAHKRQVLEAVVSYANACTVPEYPGASALLAELADEVPNRRVLLDLELTPALVKMAKSQKGEKHRVQVNSLEAIALLCIEPEGQVVIAAVDGLESMLVDAAQNSKGGYGRRHANLALCRLASNGEIRLKAVKNWSSQSVGDKFINIFRADKDKAVEAEVPSQIEELDSIIASAWDAEPRTAMRVAHRMAYLGDNHSNHSVFAERGVVYLLGGLAYSKHEEVQEHVSLAIKALSGSSELSGLILDVLLSQMKSLALSKQEVVRTCIVECVERLRPYDSTGTLNSFPVFIDNESTADGAEGHTGTDTSNVFLPKEYST